MISKINNYNLSGTQNNKYAYNSRNMQNSINIKPQHTQDEVMFTGHSEASMYKTVFEYLASEILENSGKYQFDNSLLSAKKIGDAINNLFQSGKGFPDFKRTVVKKIKWKSYIPQDVREYSVEKINQAREARLSQWKSFLENPTMISPAGVKHDSKLVEKIRKNKSLKIVIWDAVTSELKENNRHIPVPFNEKALLETIEGLERIQPIDRTTICAASSFLEKYTHRLRDNLLMDMGLSNNKEVWVKIPSIKHDSLNNEKNISSLEILSCKNWCTRSSVDKAEAALQDGDFYIYLARNKIKQWQPLVGMTTCKGKIDQIQGIENNNIVPLTLVEKIKDFIKTEGLKCQSGVYAEGPKATQGIMISEKLNEVDPISKKTFARAIRESDNFEIFKFLDSKVRKTEDNFLEISSYRPSYNLDSSKGFSIPYAMFGINEDLLLQNVRTINGNLILHNRNPLYNSQITSFPPNLETVTGRIECSKEQFAKFEKDFLRVTGGNSSKIIVHSY